MEVGTAKTTHLLSSIVDKGEEISAQIASLIAGLTADATMDRVTGSCLETLASIIRTAGSRPRSGPRLEGRDLTAAAEMYTMQNEREVHAALIGVELASGSDVVPTPDDDLGNNVELF